MQPKKKKRLHGKNVIFQSIFLTYIASNLFFFIFLPPPPLHAHTLHPFYTHTHTRLFIKPFSSWFGSQINKLILFILQFIHISSLECPRCICNCNPDQGIDYPSTPTPLQGSQIHRPQWSEGAYVILGNNRNFMEIPRCYRVHKLKCIK